MYADISLSAAALSTVIVADSNEVGTNEWILGSRFKPGFAPFPEFCWFTEGLFSITPKIFGFPSAEVVEFECQRDGAPACRYRVRWQDNEEVVRRAEYYQTRAQILEARIEALQRTVDDLVSGERLEEVLSRIVASAARAVLAPWFVLAIDALPSAARRVYAAGLDEVQALPIAKELLMEASGSGRAGSSWKSCPAGAAMGGWPRSDPMASSSSPRSGHAGRLRPSGRGGARLRDRAGGGSAAGDDGAGAAGAVESLAGISSTDEVAARAGSGRPGCHRL